MIPGTQSKYKFDTEEPKYKLVRERDNLIKESARVMWLDWDVGGAFEDSPDGPTIGRSLIMSPFNDFYTWQTTPITEILENRENYIKFKTKNSNYELFKI